MNNNVVSACFSSIPPVITSKPMGMRPIPPHPPSLLPVRHCDNYLKPEAMSTRYAVRRLEGNGNCLQPLIWAHYSGSDETLCSIPWHAFLAGFPTSVVRRWSQTCKLTCAKMGYYYTPCARDHWLYPPRGSFDTAQGAVQGGWGGWPTGNGKK